MKPKTHSILVSENIGHISLLVNEPKKMKAMMLLAHGAGAGMMHPFMETLALALAALSIGTMRYNFPYMEKGGKRPDVPAIAEKTVSVVLRHTKEIYSTVPIFLSGKSFGGRMSSQFMAKNPSEDVKGLVFYGFPLHAPGDPGIARAEHLKTISVPMLFLQGTRDLLAQLPLMEKVCGNLPFATLLKLEGADHSFKVKKAVVIDELAAYTQDWMQKHVS